MYILNINFFWFLLIRISHFASGIQSPSPRASLFGAYTEMRMRCWRCCCLALGSVSGEQWKLDHDAAVKVLDKCGDAPVAMHCEVQLVLE